MTRSSKESGYTIFEIIIVLVVMGIIGAVVGIRLSDYNTDITLDRAARQLISDVRYAQEMAMSGNRGVNFNISGNTYNLTWSDGSVVMSTFNRGNTEGDMGELGVTLSGSSFSFTRDGLPSSGISLSVSNGSDTRTITVNATTGYSQLN